MLQINELQIDNFVKCKVSNDAGIYKILSIDGYNLKVILNGARQGEWHNLDKIKPIKLTSEILEKCGFEKYIDNSDDLTYYTMKLNDEKKCELALSSGDKNGICEVTLSPYEDYFRYQYLHQIQNIYFSITQKELLINI